jgi:hypothetical protein
MKMDHDEVYKIQMVLALGGLEWSMNIDLRFA